jgi:hypothetical protein
LACFKKNEKFRTKKKRGCRMRKDLVREGGKKGEGGREGGREGEREKEREDNFQLG